MEKVYLLPIKGAEGRKQIIFFSKDLAELYKTKNGYHDLDVVQINMNATKFLNVESESVTKQVFITDDYGVEYHPDVIKNAKLSKVLKKEIKSVESLIDDLEDDDLINDAYESD